MSNASLSLCIRVVYATQSDILVCITSWLLWRIIAMVVLTFASTSTSTSTSPASASAIAAETSPPLRLRRVSALPRQSAGERHLPGRD